jgi:(1->4)-alpha-D-glucan 1-alpha-D-glucosylmutase
MNKFQAYTTDVDNSAGSLRSVERDPAGAMLPRATLRLQLHREFDFAAARRLVPYAAALGISHFYVSPILTARAGSRHGYDIVDHGAVNPELGGEAALRDLVAALRAQRMGLVVDIVPNHMAVGGADNRAWLDVLEWGPASRYANFFDIDWDVPDPALARRVLVPLLGQPYGAALADIALCFDAHSGRFFCRYFEHRLPLTPGCYPLLLRSAGEIFAPHLQRLRSALGPTRGVHFDESCRAFAGEVQSGAALRGAVQQLLSIYNAGTPLAFARLHRLLERQHYRLAWWRTAADEINWRRFFDVIELAGIRVQDPAVFEIAHATIFRLYVEGLIDGVRIDHIDGLADPRTYCRRLRNRFARLGPQRPISAPRGAPYVIVEKILGANERLVRDWQVHGTTGYTFMNAVGALFHAPHGEQPLSELWARFTGRSGEFEAEEKKARRRIPQELLAADFNACAHALHSVARLDPATRDWTAQAIRRVLTEILVQFPVYRTYADARGRSAADADIMAQTIAAARPFCRSAERPLLDLIDLWLGGEAPLQVAPFSARRARLRAIARFQQLSSPVAAKSVEDTAFYRHGRLLSRNEVGANPAQFCIDRAEFERECVMRAASFPHAMLATATHDHKRGEDLRMRLAVLSEEAPAWAAAVSTWREQNRIFKSGVDGDAATTGTASEDPAREPAAPDAADEYMLYQMLVGAWPLELSLADTIGLQQLAERLSAWQLKAVREAKRHTSWAQPDEAYEHACSEFLHAILDPQRAPNFLCNLHRFVQRIAPAGAVNALAQTALRLTTPGVPDLYQGREYWDFSLVDPDNRRPVDFARRAATLPAAPSAALLAQLLASWRDGRIKQYLIWRCLALRESAPALFTRGAYIPLEMVPSKISPSRPARTKPVLPDSPAPSGAAHYLAFLRRHRRQAVLVVIPRFCNGLVREDSLQIDAARLPSLQLPQLPPGPWRNALSAELRAEPPRSAVELLGPAPLAIWHTDNF